MQTKWTRSHATRLAGCILVACAYAGVNSANAAEEDQAAEILSMTGARTKIVWAHGLSGKNDEYVSLPDYQLMGFDTQEKKARVILPGPASYLDPIITPDGLRVVYTSKEDSGGVTGTGTVCIVDWDGTNKRSLLPHSRGMAVWQDPNDGSQWLYALADGKRIVRYRLDDMKVSEVVWSKTPIGPWFGVSADGTRALIDPPGTSALVAVLPDKGARTYEGGCNQSFAPDNSYRLMMFGAPIGHEGVLVFDVGHRNKRVIPFNNYPGLKPRTGSSSPRWTNDVRFFTVSSISGEHSDDWLGEFTPAFDGVKRWINVTRMDGQNFKSHAWIDPGLGAYSGEIPFAVSVPAFRLPAGEWTWDWGDGSAKETAAAGRHTYAKAGRYRITAQKADATLAGYATVLEHPAPAVEDTALFDSTHLTIRFNKRVALQGDAKVALASGREVKAFRLDPEEQELLVELAAPFEANEGLLVSGIVDLAQQPLPLAPAAGKVTVSRPAWPSRRDDLVYLFESRSGGNFVLDPANNMFRALDWIRLGDAHFDRDGVMSLHGGSFYVAASEYGLMDRCGKTGKLSIEAVVMPPFAQGSIERTTPILYYHLGQCDQYGHPAGLLLAQEGEKLVFYYRPTLPKGGFSNQSTRVELGTLALGRPNHVALTSDSNRLVAYIDGKQVMETAVDGNPVWDSRNGSAHGIIFAGRTEKDAADVTFQPWQGRIEGVAMYARVMDAGEVAKDAELSLSRALARKALPQIEVEATLVATTPTPTLKEIEPYHSALLACEYTVDKVLKGDAALKKVRVYQWGIIDSKFQPITQAKPGLKAKFLLETWKDHPELGSELQRDGLSDDFEAPLFVEAEHFEKSDFDKRGVATENTSLRLLPAPGKVVIDGKCDDWDLTGGIFVCGNVEKRRDTQSAWIHAMYDADNLYLLARWRDETPMNNPKDTRKDKDGYNGDSLQFRFLSEANTPQERCVHLTCWHGSDNGDAVEIVYGRKFDQACTKQDRELNVTSQAFVRSEDGKGYVQEIAIPWALLTSGGKRPAAALATVEINFTDPSGRVNVADLLQAGSVAAGITGFNHIEKWGTLTFETKGPVAPQPVHLADKRTFPVAAAPGTLTVEWKGLSK